MTEREKEELKLLREVWDLQRAIIAEREGDDE